MEKTIIKFKKLHPDAIIPSKAHKDDIGYDVTAIDVEYDYENDRWVYHTGLAIESDYGVGAFLAARSNLCKKDAYIPNGFGLIDTANYRGEFLFILKPHIPAHSIVTRIAFERWMRLDEGTKENVYFNDFGCCLREVEFEIMEQMEKNPPYKPGEKVCQLIIFEHPEVEIKEVEELTETARGSNGFGSTGL